MKQTALKAIVVTLCGMAFAQPENPPVPKKKQHKGQQECAFYDSANKDADANKKLAVLNTRKEEDPGIDELDLLGRIDHLRILAQSVVRGQTSLPAQPAPVKRQTQPESIEIPTSTQVMATRIGQHHLGETLQEWYRHEPDANRQTENIGDIGSHRVGETFAQWLQFNSLDLDDICHKHSDKSIDFKSVCRRLSAIRDSGSGEFYTTDQAGRTFGWRFSDGQTTPLMERGTIRLPPRQAIRISRLRKRTTENIPESLSMGSFQKLASRQIGLQFTQSILKKELHVTRKLSLLYRRKLTF